MSPLLTVVTARGNSTDDASSIDVVRHALDAMGDVMRLQPTSR